MVEQGNGQAGRPSGEGMNKTLPDIDAHDALRVSAAVSVLALTVIAVRTVWVRVRMRDIRHVAATRSEVKNRYGSEELREAENVVDSTLTIETILNWPTHIPKEIN
jgi:hypothetical protein